MDETKGNCIQCGFCHNGSYSQINTEYFCALSGRRINFAGLETCHAFHHKTGRCCVERISSED